MLPPSSRKKKEIVSWTITTSEGNLNIPEKQRAYVRTYMRGGESLVVAVGEACEMVWEGVGSARGRPQAGRTSREEREKEEKA